MKISRFFLLLLLINSACSQPRVRTAVAWLPAFPPLTATPTPTITPTPTPQPTPTPVVLSFPIRAAFYNPAYPQGWQPDGSQVTRYHPGLGFYTQDDPALIAQHIGAMQYGKIQAGILAWQGPDGPGSVSVSGRIPALLEAGARAGFFWAVSVESERQSDPDPAALTASLAYIRDTYTGSLAYLKLQGRFVVFVNAGPGDGCAMAERWKQANTVGAYLVLQGFPGYQDCAAQPDAWQPALGEGEESASSTAAGAATGSSGAASSPGAAAYTISPGLWRVDQDQPPLERSLLRWDAAVRAMRASGANFQLVASFNDWSAGNAVEDAWEWSSASGYGTYLDALHFDGDLAQLYPYHASFPDVRLDVPVTLIGAGDIADCGSLDRARSTAYLLGQFPDAQIFTAGDNVQDNGQPREYQKCFDPTWGQYKDRIHPAPGNHDIGTNHLEAYYDYFGDAAGKRWDGYYSYDLGTWHIIALNSDCNNAGGCDPGSPQEQWLKADLAAHPARCTMAYWHHPLYGWAINGPHPEVVGFWQDLYDAGAELIINGHDHNFERFAPQDPQGHLDPQRGIREIVAGTGGAWSDPVKWPVENNAEVRITDTHGILLLELSYDHYAWTFIPADGSMQSDSGMEWCH